MPLDNENKPDVKNVTSNIFLVDPNPPGMGIHPAEDMFIYVKFSAFNRNRSDLVETEGEINFIATQVNYDDSGEVITNPEGNQKTYATTNYTQIGGTVDSSSRGILEGFGIKSIDIKYDASLVPRVDITFTDVRGSSLFDVIDNDNRKSPYSIFFKMPYPIFKLSVKGYFGKTVDYCLHMLNWTSDFDGSTGDFNISANFVGFQQAFLADMVLGNIIGAVNTEEGKTNLDRIYNEQEEEDSTLPPIPNNVKKIDDFFIESSKLQIKFEDIKEKNGELDKLKTLNELRSKLLRIQSFVGVPLTKQTGQDETLPYLEQKNKDNQFETSPITDNSLRLGTDYLSIRDFIIFNAIRLPDVKDYFKTLKEITLNYREFLNDKNEILKSTGGETGSVTEDSQKSLLESFKTTVTDYSYKTFLNSNFDKIIILDELFTQLSSSTLLTEGAPPSIESDINTDFNPQKYLTTTEQKTIESQDLSLENAVYMLDFREIRSQIQNSIINLSKTIKEQQKLVTEELNKEVVERLQFKPTIQNVFRIICNNTEAMLETLKSQRTTVKSPDIAKKRKDYIDSKYGIRNSDIPVKFDQFMWPSVYETSDDKGTQEIYLGSDPNLKEELFPEVKFVDEVFNNVTSSRKSLNTITQATSNFAGTDTDNWFPINPNDYDSNPFLSINTLNNKDAWKDELTKQITSRINKLNNISQFTYKGNDSIEIGGKSALYMYGYLEGINANKTIFSKDVRDYITQNYNIGLIQSDKNYLKPLSNNNFEVLDSPTQTSESYIVLDNLASKMVNNSKSLWGEISTNDFYKSIVDSPKNNNQKFIKSYYYNNNYTQNVWNYIWYNNVGNNLIKEDKKNENYKINNISVIDVSGGTEGMYINILNTNPDIEPDFATETYLTDNDFYNNFTDPKDRALLLLSTFPLQNFKKILDLFSNGYSARILRIPTYYLYYIGALLYRYQNNTMKKSEWGNSEVFYSPKENYISNLGAWNGRKENDFKIESELLNLPTNTKQTLINKFKNWVDFSTGFSDLESNVKNYKTKDLNITPTQKEEAGKNITNQLKKLSNMVLTYPKIFSSDIQMNNTISTDDIQNYFNGFKESFDGTKNDKGGETNIEKTKKKSNETENAIKLQIYNYFKNINNKWVSDDQKQTQVCGASSGLFDFFKFIDRGWVDIGDKAVINLDTVLGLSNNLDSNIYFFISTLLSKNNFLLQILPTYINYKDPVEVSQIFQPITNISEKNKNRGPAYVCIYAGGNSEILDIGENTTYSYPNDGFSFSKGEVPKDFKSSNTTTEDKVDNSLVAFKVGFGAQNQTIFKNVSLSQQEHRETAEYYKTLTDVIDKRGATQRSYQGSDLLKLFKTRSYSCKVDAMGCMNIQPLMYFDLQNVPFFNGAYLITSVNHSISPNSMTTNFTGLRQSKFVTPYVDQPTAFLNVDLEDDLDLEDVVFTNNLTTNINFSVGLNEEVENLPFDYAQITTDKLTELGVITDGTLDIPTPEEIRSLLQEYGIITNSQVTMFLTNVLVNSENLSKNIQTKAENYPNLEDYIVRSGTSQETLYYDVNDVNNFTITQGLPIDIVYNPKGDTFKNDSKPDSLGNKYNGDSWRFRKRGYLYIEGRDVYTKNYKGGDYGTNPYSISDDVKISFDVACYVWTNVKDLNQKKSSNDWANEKGDSTTFEQTTKLSIPNIKERDVIFNKFVQVLSSFTSKDGIPLISFERS